MPESSVSATRGKSVKGGGGIREKNRDRTEVGKGRREREREALGRWGEEHR